MDPFSLAKGFQTSENAPTRIKFRTLRSASKGFALLKPTTFWKRRANLKDMPDENFCFLQTTRLCAEGEQGAGSAYRASVLT